MRNLWTLYRKELSGLRSDFMVVVGIILVWEVFLATRQGKWPGDLVFGLSFLPYALLPLWAIIAGIQSLRKEWNENTIYALLSLPTRGWTIAGAKALALATEFTFYALLVPVFSRLFLKDTTASLLLGSEMKRAALADVALKGFALYWLILATVTVVGQFSYVISAMFERFQWIVGGWIFVLSAYILTRGAQVVSPLFAWLPDLPLKTYSEANGIALVGTVLVDTAPIIGTIVLVAAMFATTSILIEKSVEV